MLMKRACSLAAVPVLVVALACGGLGWGCSKAEPDKKEDSCKTGQLKMSAKISKELAASGTPERMGCPSRISTAGAGPPIDAWVGGAEAYWGPELIVQLDKEATAEAQKADGETGCTYTWRQGCL